MSSTTRTMAQAVLAAVAVPLLIVGAGAATATPGSGGNAVPVPPGYDYNPSGPKPRLHDYCSYVYNGPPGADFRGACAKHDMCMEAKDRQGDSNYTSCHDQLSGDLKSECRWSFGEWDPRRAACLAGVGAMMLAVRTAN